MNYARIRYQFSAEKNLWLILKRQISFEEVIGAIDNGQLLNIVAHPNQEKYPNQKMYVLKIKGYVYLVPFVAVDQQTIFLKTIFASRKAKKKYTRGKEGKR
jgi:hypothetical protein